MYHSAPCIGQPGHLAHPVGGHLFHFSERRAGLPGEAQHAEAGRGEVAEDARQQAIRGEVSEEARVLPVGQPRHNDLVEIAENGGEGFRFERGFGGKLPFDLARRGSSHHRQPGDARPVVGDPIDQLVSRRAKFFRSHVRLPICALWQRDSRLAKTAARCQDEGTPRSRAVWSSPRRRGRSQRKRGEDIVFSA